MIGVPEYLFYVSSMFSTWWFQPLGNILVKKLGSSSPNFRGETKDLCEDSPGIFFLILTTLGLDFFLTTVRFEITVAFFRVILQAISYRDEDFTYLPCFLLLVHSFGKA